MTAVVTAASLVACGHGGKVATVGTPKLTVGGSPVLVASGVAGMTVTGCGTPTVTTTPPSSPCTTVLTVTTPTSLATKLFVDGDPVVTAALAGTTNGVVSGTTPQTLLSATVTQTFLTTA
jgi:hypothetical protein